jgi:predicted enzyme related to lactoylglutathione lyase
MNQGISVIIYPVKDLAGAKAIYGKLLDTEPYVDAPYYLGYRVGGLEIGFNPHGHNEGMTGPVGYWQVADIRAIVKELLEAGGQAQQEVTDVGGGKLTATVKDTDGNVIGLVQSPL